VAAFFYFRRILSPAGRWIYYRRPFHEGSVMDWKLELHSLIESTMALAKNAKAQSNSDLALDIRPIPAAMPMIRPMSERDEILRRVSNFRAHQEKMAREREGYYLQTKARMLVPADPNLTSLNSRKNPPA
jgi:hypothetical protein